MNKYLLFITFSIWVTGVNGQYNNYPKLQSLYNNSHYDKCLEKAESEIKSDPVEVWPFIWQMRSYMAINELDNHPLKKNALSKALNIALRIKKKDKDAKLNEELNADFNNITTRTIEQVMSFPEKQYGAGLNTFEKLKTLNYSLYLEYQKYLYMLENADPNAFITLRNLVTTHYSLSKKNEKFSENFEQAYADLMNEYLEHAQINYAKDVYYKAGEVYKNGILCKENYLHYIKNRASYLGYYSDEETLSFDLSICKTADSILNDQSIKLTIQKIKKYSAVYSIRYKPAKDKYTSYLILDYLKNYNPNAADSANTFFDDLMAVNETANLKIKPHTIIDYWITATIEIKQLRQPIEAIKSIHQYYLTTKKYQQDAIFLDDCRNNYPSLKTHLMLLQAELEKLILEQISTPEYDENPELADKYTGKTNNKAIKDKQYKLYFTNLSALLNINNFSGFAVNIHKALSMFPNDPQLLALQKRWVINDYKANYVTTTYDYEKFFTKLPNESTCEPGIVNKTGHDAVLQKINYFRRLAGSPDSCVLDEALNSKCQKAAFMMSVNSALSHAPPKTWKCYTPEGASGAGASNLSLGAAFANAIIGQMEDDGAGNTACGHRRWILNPTNTVFGHGSTMGASSLYAFGSSNNALKRKIYFDEKQAICWPAASYFPIRLVPTRWSISLEDANFDKATVEVTENGKKLNVSIEPISNGYGPNTLVFIINGMIEVNKTYVITVRNIQPYTLWDEPKEEKLKTRTITYQVIPIEIN